MRIVAYMTGEYVTEESAAHGDAEKRGWAYSLWSRRVFFDSRDDVIPVLDADTEDADFASLVSDVLSSFGAIENDGNGTFYAAPEQDLENGGWYSYALHFSAIHPDGREERWDPRQAGIVI